MPRELIAIAPGEPRIQEYEEPRLQSGQVRIQSAFSSPKHGTEQGPYKGISVSNTSHWDPRLNLAIPGNPEIAFPFPLGNMTVGTVTEIGPEVDQFRIGDRVFGYLPIRETHTVSEESIFSAPEGMSSEAIVYWDPAVFALGAVRDANMRLGEKAAVFGLGAIGFMVLQMARLSGAELLIAVDPLENRRKLAVQHGADLVFDPTTEDVAMKIKKATNDRGVDVSIEASGAYPGLHEAIRCVHVGGLVVPLAAYKGNCNSLQLDAEWHRNRVTMRSSRACTGNGPGRLM